MVTTQLNNCLFTFICILPDQTTNHGRDVGLWVGFVKNVFLLFSRAIVETKQLCVCVCFACQCGLGVCTLCRCVCVDQLRQRVLSPFISFLTQWTSYSHNTHFRSVNQTYRYRTSVASLCNTRGPYNDQSILSHHFHFSQQASPWNLYAFVLFLSLQTTVPGLPSEKWTPVKAVLCHACGLHRLHLSRFCCNFSWNVMHLLLTWLSSANDLLYSFCFVREWSYWFRIGRSVLSRTVKSICELNRIVTNLAFWIRNEANDIRNSYSPQVLQSVVELE